MSNTDPHSAVARTPRRAWGFVIPAALFVFVLLGLVGLAAATGWEDTKNQLARISAWQFGGLLGLSLVNYGLRGLRWHMFARHLGLTTTLVQNFRHFIGGFAMSVTPGRVGELVRMRWIRRETGWNFEKTAPLMLLDRSSDLSAMAVLLGAAVMLSTSGIGGAIPITVLALAVAVIATRPRLLTALADLGFRLVRRHPRLFARIRIAARSLEKFASSPVVFVAGAIGAVGWFAEGFAFYLVLLWMGTDIGVASAVAIFIFSTMAGGLTGAPGGIGGAEAAMVALLSLEGVPMETSIPATAVIRVTTLWFAIILGFAVIPFAERYSLRVKNALEES